MNARQDDANVSWRLLGIIAAVVGTIAVGAIWLGAVAKQTDVNTVDIKRIYDYLSKIVEHDATTTAEHRAFDRRFQEIEKRLDALEKRN